MKATKVSSANKALSSYEKADKKIDKKKGIKENSARKNGIGGTK